MSTIPICVAPTIVTKITETQLRTGDQNSPIDSTWVPMQTGARILININWGMLDYPDPATVGHDDEPKVDPRAQITWCFADGVEASEVPRSWRPPTRVMDRIDQDPGSERFCIHATVPGAEWKRRVKEVKRRERAAEFRDQDFTESEGDLKWREYNLKTEETKLKAKLEALNKRERR